MLSFLKAIVVRDLSFRTRLRRHPHLINIDSLASTHSTSLARESDGEGEGESEGDRIRINEGTIGALVMSSS